MTTTIQVSDTLKNQLEILSKIRNTSINEIIKDSLEISEELEVRSEYVKVLNSKDANTFLSEEESENFMEEMRTKVLQDD
jgi:predicted transcriptional regulator